MANLEEESSCKRTRLSALIKYLAKMLNSLLCILLPKIENLEEEQQQQSISDSIAAEIPEEITSEILSRLPVKTLLQLRSVSKQWRSLISTPSFHKLQFTQATAGRRTAVLISAYDTSTRRRYMLSAARDGGPVTHLMTPRARTITNRETTEIEHLNGLVLFTSGNGFIEHNFAYLLNPSTRKIFKLPDPASELVTLSYGNVHICYFFGFDESRNEHKILHIRMFNIQKMNPFRPSKIEIMIFSLSSLSWRKINVDLPSGVILDWNIGTKHSVCVNSVIHLILQNQNRILAFDLRTEKFSIMNLPVDAIPDAIPKRHYRKGMNSIISNHPFVMKINGFLGVMWHNPVVGLDEMDVWTLEDYESCVWIKKTSNFSKSWFVLDGPLPLNSFKNRLSLDMISVPIYDVESDSIKSVEFTLGYEFLHPRTVRFDHVMSYTESILPLPSN